MRFPTSLLTAIVLGLLILNTGFAGQGGSGGGSAKKPEEKAPAPPAQTVPEDGVPRVTAVEAHDAVEKGKAIIVDVRSESSYRMGHIQGALWMPDVASRTKELPRDKMIVFYCS
jgi:3-mercaptopyruvate sulfurtransferase SseA